MMELLCLIFPSALAVYIYQKIKPEAGGTDLLIKFGMFVLFSNMISFFILVIYSGMDYQLFLSASPLSFVLKCLVLNTGINLFIAFLLIRVEEKIEWNIKMKVEKNGKK